MPHKPGHKRKKPELQETQTRPTGTPVSRNVDITPSRVSPKEISERKGASGREGLIRRGLERERERADIEFEFAEEGKRAAGLPTQAEEREQARAFLDEKGILTEQSPERTELNPPEREGFLETLPVIGASIAAQKGKANTILGVAVDREMFGLKKEKELQTLIQNPETAREKALQQIQKDVLKKGRTRGERFGTFVEGIPAVGSLVAKYASGLIEDPKGNIETILTEIDSERERASVIAEKVFTGKLGNPLLAIQTIETIEDRLAFLEQRIKLLADSSPQLRASSDELDRIEEKILRAKERVFIAKQAAAAGLLAPATDANIFLTLQGLQNE